MMTMMTTSVYGFVKEGSWVVTAKEFSGSLVFWRTRRWQELGDVEVHLGDDGRDCPQWPETNTH